MSHHDSSGSCPKCKEVFDRYLGFDSELKDWFFSVQKVNPDFHCADAGRGKIEQETYFNRKASLAHYGQSSHNYNCGIDTFFQIAGAYVLDRNLYEKQILPLMPDWIQWGAHWTSFPEIPHFERKDWLQLVMDKKIKLVE